MSQGIVLLALNKPAYMSFAFNMALSIKANNPDIKIQLVHSAGLQDSIHPYMLQVFDSFTEMAREDIYVEEPATRGPKFRFEPGRAKLNLYKYLGFDENIYLDVDGICVRDLSTLFTHCKKDIHAQIQNKFDQTADAWPCLWMPLDNVRKHYPLPDTYKLFEINSSFLFTRKGPTAERFYEQSLKNYREDIPKKDFGNGWGNRFPDELAYNIAFAQCDIDPSLGPLKPGDERDIEPIYFRTYTDNKRPADSLELIKQKHWAIGVWGSHRLNHSSIVSSAGYYDKLVNLYMKQVFGKNIIYKIHRLMENKHVLNTK